MDGEGAGAKEALNWHEYFTYKPETGDLIWKERPLSHFVNASYQKRWNDRYAYATCGKLCFSKTGHRNGKIVRVHKRSRIVHRIIWEMHHGPIPPKMEIDHIDRDPFNNRIENLRLATCSQNKGNTRRRGGKRACKSGIKGVCWRKDCNRWLAAITMNGKYKHIGLFVNKEDAAEAYKKKAIEFFGQFAFADREQPEH